MRKRVWPFKCKRGKDVYLHANDYQLKLTCPCACLAVVVGSVNIIAYPCPVYNRYVDSAVTEWGLRLNPGFIGRYL